MAAKPESIELPTLAGSQKTGYFSEFTDNHMHLDPINGEGMNAARKFERAGGRYIFLVCKMTHDWGLKPTIKGFEELFDRTIAFSDEINAETAVTSYPVIGIHPAEFARMCEATGTKKALGVAKKALSLAGKRVDEGLAVALGEVGRPHYEVPQEILEASNNLMKHAFGIAKDAGCAVQLHTESAGEEQLHEFAQMARDVGLSPGRVIKHYSPVLIRAAESAGIFPSLIASEDNVRSALKEGTRFLMESDYIDDLKRPGAVVGPKSVPRVSQQLFEKGVVTERDLIRIHRENVEEAYGISLG